MASEMGFMNEQTFPICQNRIHKLKANGGTNRVKYSFLWTECGFKRDFYPSENIIFSFYFHPNNFSRNFFCIQTANFFFFFPSFTFATWTRVTFGCSFKMPSRCQLDRIFKMLIMMGSELLAVRKKVYKKIVIK